MDERSHIIMINFDGCTLSASWRVKQYVLLLSFKTEIRQCRTLGKFFSKFLKAVSSCKYPVT